VVGIRQTVQRSPDDGWYRPVVDRPLTSDLNHYLIPGMGRTAGATAAGTTERLLRAAADVFAVRGYEGTRVADIAATASLSNGALYAYFGSKADLLVGALRVHGRRLLSDLVATDPSRPITDLLLVAGRSLRRRRDAHGYLVIEALVAARRHPDVAAPLRDYVRERGDWLADLVGQAQARGELDPSLPPRAVAHLCLSLAVGTALVTPDLHDVDDQEWDAFLARLVTALGPIRTGDQLGIEE
jgi:AcrR family transcriptional regulator